MAVRFLVLASLLLAPSAAQAKVTWLCNPDLKSNPCVSSLTATVITPDGKRSTERKRVARDPKIDCFYVYPTVSGQSTPAANLKIDAEQRAIAHAQASRFSEHCRVFAPVYRQITLAGLIEPDKVTVEMRQQAFTDVRNAFRDYLARFNKGRGFVLLSHSQGTYVLRELIKAEVDKKRTTRARLVSALLLGGDVLVAKGKKVGGDFANVPGCTSPKQNACVVAYSMYGQTPPPDSRFGRADEPGKHEVLCTNPAALGGGSGGLHPYTPDATFPGILGDVQRALVTLPRVRTPWLASPGAAKARCASSGGAAFLRVTAASDSAPKLTAAPDPTWGFHLGDINLALGDLTELVRRQARAYLAR